MTNRKFNTGELVIWTPQARKEKEKANSSKAKNRFARKNANRIGGFNIENPHLEYNWPLGIMKVLCGEDFDFEKLPPSWKRKGWVVLKELNGGTLMAFASITELEHLQSEDQDLLLTLDDIGL